MPTWQSLAAFGKELAALERDLTGIEQRQITRTMGEQAQKIAASHAARDLGGDRAFSGWSAGPLDTRLRNVSNNTLLTPTRRSAGPWTVAEFGRHSQAGPRLIGPRLTRTGRVSKAKQRRWNGRTAPKHTASESARDMERQLPKVADRAVLIVTRKRFTVT